MTLTTVCLLAPHLTADNHERVLKSSDIRASATSSGLLRTCVHSLRRQQSFGNYRRTICDGNRNRPLVAALNALDFTPVADAPAVQKKPPVAKMSSLAPELYKLQVTLRRSTREKLCHVQNLLRHTLPDGDVAAILDRLYRAAERSRTQQGRANGASSAAA